MQAEDLLEALFLIKRELRELEYKEKYVKDEIHALLDAQGTDRLRTDRFEVVRSNRARETMSKGNTPRAVWNEFHILTEYQALNLKPL